METVGKLAAIDLHRQVQVGDIGRRVEGGLSAFCPSRNEFSVIFSKNDRTRIAGKNEGITFAHVKSENNYEKLSLCRHDWSGWIVSSHESDGKINSRVYPIHA